MLASFDKDGKPCESPDAMESTPEAPKTVETLKTVERALQLLELLARRDGPVSVKTLAAESGLNLTTGYHLVNTLASRGFVAKSGTMVALGHTIALLGAAYSRQFQIAESALPLIKKLRSSTGETSYLATWTNGRVIVQVLEEGDQSIRVGGLYVGFAGDEHLRASGRAVLAMLPEIELEMYLTGLPRPTRLGIQKVELMQELESVRSEGYAIERGNFNAGVACVATPFFDALGKIAGAVAVSAPMERFDKEFENLIANAVATANSVTALYGGAS